MCRVSSLLPNGCQDVAQRSYLVALVARLLMVAFRLFIPEPPFFPPLSCLLTVAQARAAAFSLTHLVLRSSLRCDEPVVSASRCISTCHLVA